LILAEIITIGDEILIGQIVDTNSAFIAKQLNKIGISVYQITSVQDDKKHILEALAAAKSRVSIVICTGGLGPTKDDITKHTFCDFFNDTLVQNTQVLEHVELLFKKHIATPISDLNRKQALVPTKATVLHNAHGTAPGMLFFEEDVTYISLPGVPFEMKHIVTNEVLPVLIDQYERPHIIHKTLVTYGLGESVIAERIEDWEERLPSFIKLAYLPSLGKVRLRLTARGQDRVMLINGLADACSTLYPLIGDILYGTEDEETLEQLVAKLLANKNYTLAAAESFTGGKIASAITAIPGASIYFKGAVVSYATTAKVKVLNISEIDIAEHSVVSAEVAKTMASNVRQLFGADIGIATTGNAGPEKGDSDAAVGTVFIAIDSPLGVHALQFNMGSNRERVVQKSVNKAFEMLQKEIIKL